MKIQMNDTRKKVLEVLAKADGNPLTLAEISKEIGVEVKSGTTNALVADGIIKKVGTKKVAKTTYVEVATYTLGDGKVEA